MAQTQEAKDDFQSDLGLAAASTAEKSLATTRCSGHNLNNVDFSGRDLSGVNLNETSLINTNFSHANLSNCSIYGIAAWDIQLDEQTIQKNLTITPLDQPAITVDNLKIAQFIYVLLNNAEIRDAIDTIAKKAVLILGRFIIVDLTDPSSAPYEVSTIASNHIRPIQALFHPSNEAKRVFAMYPDLVRRYHWVLPPYEYQDQEPPCRGTFSKVDLQNGPDAEEILDQELGSSSI